MTKGDGMLVTDSYNKIVDCEERPYSIMGEPVLAFALAGTAKARTVLEYALGEGVEITSALDTDDYFSAIIVTKRSAYYVNKEEEGPQLSILEIDEGMPMCCGTGSKIATHFLLHTQCDPMDAVVQAVKSDVFSGGELVRWSRP
jgi:hypothetical protein